MDLPWGDAPTLYTRQVRASVLGRLYEIAPPFRTVRAAYEPRRPARASSARFAAERIDSGAVSRLDRPHVPWNRPKILGSARSFLDRIQAS